MTDSVAQRLAELRRDYVRALPDRLAAVRIAWQALAQAGDGIFVHTELVRAVHGLSGSGGSFGCESLSLAARQLEDFLKSLAPDKLSGADNQSFERLFAGVERAARQCAERLAVQRDELPSQCLRGASPGTERPLLYVLEDETEFAADLLTQLQQAGFSTRLFVSGAELAAALAEAPAPAALIIDVVLNGQPFGGVEILRQLRRKCNVQIPAIFLTVCDDFATRLAAVRAGGTHYFNKPVDMHRLAALLNIHTRGEHQAGYRVLLVDDDVGIAALYRPALEAAGIRLEVVSEPSEAVQAVSDFDPELILMDVYMPGISGLELAAVIRQNDAHEQIPIVFLSAETDLDRQLAAMNLGGDEFLIKPITPERLTAAVLPRVRRVRLMREALDKAQATLNELQQHKAALDEHAIVSIADIAGHILYANPKFCEISGYRLDELLGQNHRLINSGHHPKEFFADMWRTISLGQVWHGEICNRKKDGRLYWVESTIAPQLDVQGRPYQYISIRTDITSIMEADQRLRESETRLSEAQRIAHVGSWEWDIEHDRLAWSDEIYRIFGLAPQQFGANYEAFMDAVHPDDRAAVQASEERALRGGSHDVEHRIVRPDGSIGWVQERGEVLFGPDGRPVLMRGTVQDITRSKQSEQELVLAREQAETASQAKTQFLASMSHELRTPLNAILGFAQLIDLDADGELLPSQKENIGQILNAGWHLLELINEVLDLSRIESGVIQQSIEIVELPILLGDCLDTLRPQAAAQQVVLNEFACSCGHPAVRGDRLRLKQVLLNLLSNAIKYNRHRGTVSVHCRKQGQRVRITVQDNGLGLSPEQQNNLFQAFNRLGRESENIDGSGIGLLISKRLIEMMGGEIGVESKAGEGSSFWIELDVVDDVEMPQPPSPTLEPAPKVPSPVAAGAGHVLLYIEDNIVNIKLIEKIISRLSGVQLRLAPNGAEGVVLARKLRPSLILLDMNLPDMHGLDVLAALQQNADTREIPVFALSADAMPREIERARAAGIRAYYTKPLDIRAFQEAVGEVLAQWPGDRTAKGVASQ